MNYKKLGKILGKIMIMEGVLMLAPLIVTFFYGFFDTYNFTYRNRFFITNT